MKNQAAVALGKMAKGVKKTITPERREWLRKNMLLTTKKRVAMQAAKKNGK